MAGHGVGFSLGMLGKPTGEKPGILEALNSATAYYTNIETKT